jgi:YbbR domain-containing protein
VELPLVDKLRVSLTENLGLKLVSFACALFLYSLVHSSQDAQRSMSASLVVTLPPGSGNRVLVNQLPPQVRLLLRGAPAKLDDLHADDLGVQADLLSTNERTLKLDPKMVHAPPGVRVEVIDPASVELIWEDIITRDVPIQVSVVGSPAAGFMVKGAPLADPAVVRAHGPKSEVLGIQYARAAAFEVNGLTEGNYQRQLLIDSPPARVTYDTNMVGVSTQITREVVERPFIKLPVIVIGPPKAKTFPAEVDVRLACPSEIVRALRPEQVVPHVEEKGTATSGSESLPVTVQVDKCEAHVTPSSVIVRW